MTDPNPKVPRRERERLRHRQEILDAARQIVGDRGIEGVTVEQVAKQADFAVGSIYRHFSSKEDLILAVVGEFADGMFEEMAAVTADDRPFDEQLARFVRLSLAHQAECQPLFEALMTLPGQFPAPGSETGTRMMAMHQRFLGALDAIVALGEEAGELRKGARSSHVIALGALLHGYAKVACMGGVPMVADPTHEILRSFLHGARAEGGVA